MIKVTIELLPHGNEKQKKHLGTIEINNMGGGVRLGRYAYTVLGEDGTNNRYTVFRRAENAGGLAARAVEEGRCEYRQCR